MLSRSHGQQKIKTPADPTPAGKVFQVEGSDLHIYVPSWCLGEIDGLQLIPKTHSPQGTYCHKRIADAFFAYHSTSTIPTEKICDQLNIAAEQSKYDLLSVIIQDLQTRCDNTRFCSLHKLLSPRLNTYVGRIKREAGSQRKEQDKTTTCG